jgi:cation/acetate symporter
MYYEPSTIAVVVFFFFVALTLGLSFYLGKKAKTSSGYFAAHGQIHWFVNGVAFAGDYLSAASFLGICGMIAFFGYDGFLYSIGYLAGWIVALFVIAEPLKRMGKYTLADALDSKFQSTGIQCVVGLSTLAISIFYLIPQMVGAGVLIQPLFGFPHWVGVVMVGATVILIVVTAGMVSTTWVQFLKGSLLVIFSLVLTVMILAQGFESVPPDATDNSPFRTLGPFDQTALADQVSTTPGFESVSVIDETNGWIGQSFVRTRDRASKEITVWSVDQGEGNTVQLREGILITKTADGEILINGLPQPVDADSVQMKGVGYITRLPGNKQSTGPVGPLEFFSILQNSEIMLWKSTTIKDGTDTEHTVYYQKLTPGSEVLRPGNHPNFIGIRSDNLLDKLNFLSLMLALFCGTAALPHILIRYYTVKDEASARKSTIVGIGAIGFFYILTLYMGLGAMTSGALDVTNSNMAAPLLAKSMNEWLFAIISAIAFTTVLGTVSGLILASSGSVAHDFATNVLKIKLSDHEKVRVAKIASVVVGVIAIVLGILFEKMNVSYLVGWAFSVAASANLPSLIMLLFWSGTTRQGIIAAVSVGMASSLGWILLSGDTFSKVYGLPAESGWVPFSQPGIVTIPLGFITLIVVSRLTGSNRNGR